MKLFILLLILCPLACNAMGGWQVPIPTLSALAADRVVTHHKKDESQCPVEINAKIAWMKECKKDPSKALEKAIKDNNEEQIDFLLYKKVKVGFNYWIPDELKLQAIKENTIAKIKKWLMAGLHINNCLNEDEYNYIYLLEQDLAPEMRSFLTMNIFDLGNNPLMNAIKQNNIDRIKSLLSQGAYVNIRKSLGITPLHKALSTEVVDCLMNHGAEINAQDFYHRTPLKLAIRNGRITVAEKLIKHGADVALLPSKMYCKLADTAEINAFLLNKGINSTVSSDQNLNETRLPEADFFIFTNN